MRLAAALLVLAAALPAQQRTVYLSMPDAVLVSARTVQMSATLRDQTNAIVASNFNWSSNNTAIATVDSSGVVTGRRPGLANISANAAGVTGTMQIQVVPLRIDVSPAQKAIKVGESLQYTARAIDADGQPIDGVTFTWQTLGANGGQINAARIDGTGLVLTNAIARVTVRATINYANTAQFSGQFVGTARLEIRPADSYRLTRLLASDEAPRLARLRPSNSPIAVAENGNLAFLCSLDGYSNGIVLYEGGRFSVLASTGMPKPLYGGQFSDFSSLSVNSKGEVLTNATGPNVANLPGINGLMLFSREGSRVLFINGSDSININNNPVARHSLNDRGDVVFHANFAGANALFRISEGSVQAVWSTLSPLPGLASPYQFEDWGIDGAGDVYFRARSGPALAVYRASAGSAPVRLIGIGDTLAGGKISAMYWLSIAQSGDVAVAADIPGTSDRYYVRIPKGSAPGQWQVRSQSGGGVLGTVGPAGVLFDSPQGLVRWQGNTITTALTIGRPVFNGEPGTSIFDSAMSAAGTVFAVVQTPSGYVLVRDGTVIADSSTVVEGMGLFSIAGFVQGARTGPAHLLMDNSNRNVFEIDSSGLRPRLLVGDRIGDGNTSPRLANVRKTASGDMYVSWSSDRIFRLTPDGAMPQFRVPPCDLAGCIGFGGFGGANPDGTVLWTSFGNNGNSRMYLTQNGQHNLLLSYTGNTTFVGPPVSIRNFSMALDGRGRAMSWINADPVSASGLYVYDSGSWQRVLSQNGRLLDLPEVSNASVLEALDDGFLVSLFSRYDGTVLARWRDGSWQTLMARNELAAVGGQINGVQRARANSGGEVAVGLSWNGNSGVNIRMADGSLRPVLVLGDALPEGGYVAEIVDLDYRDDGRVYILLRDFEDRTLVYLAEPI